MWVQKVGKMTGCTIFAYSASPHLSQLYTGFSLLAMKGQINLRQRLDKYTHKGKELESLNLQSLETPVLFAVLNDNTVVFYDTGDSSVLRQDALEIADGYFKRSYLKAAIPERYRSKVFPLGLNYEVYTGQFDRYELARVLWRKSALKSFPIELGRRLAELASLSYLPSASTVQSPPRPDREPFVLFMARAWDPCDEPPGLSAQDRAERVQVNEMRAHCIEYLRKYLGRRFFGGFARTKYAARRFPELLLDNSEVSGKKNYMSLLQQYPICIATAGLHGSIGWKMGEYVACSRAIVSERFECSLPGDFAKDRNYLEFDAPARCVEQTMRLVETHHLRREMMELNHDYYHAYLAPDRLIQNTLTIVSNR